jgi:hypothetical protein
MPKSGIESAEPGIIRQLPNTPRHRSDPAKRSQEIHPSLPKCDMQSPPTRFLLKKVVFFEAVSPSAVYTASAAAFRAANAKG